jgi:DNA-binding NarL/FixJ family response regulator
MTLRCLIVDNNPGVLAATRRLLEHEGITVVGVASNSAEALQRAEELRPDVTLVAMDLGSESGLELAQRRHREATTAPSPVILISTYAKENFADLIAATPAIGFLPKYAVTASAIRDLLASHGHTDPGDRVSRPPEG